ncbi:hypothetical protein ACNTMW_19465 [Planosporangium sp. 12N6]|uniref:hypothetical protein n=1 Tax=Planosporangium spinosum TaxID=3402278 RepID=UPI003CF871F5
MPAAFVIALNEAHHDLNSARPDAPVVSDSEPVGWTRTIRAALSEGLHRAARAIAPAEPGPAPVEHCPAH